MRISAMCPFGAFLKKTFFMFICYKLGLLALLVFYFLVLYSYSRFGIRCPFYYWKLFVWNWRTFLHLIRHFRRPMTVAYVNVVIRNFFLFASNGASRIWRKCFFFKLFYSFTLYAYYKIENKKLWNMCIKKTFYYIFREINNHDVKCIQVKHIF